MEAQEGLSWFCDCPCQGHTCRKKLPWIDAQDTGGVAGANAVSSVGLHFQPLLTDPEFKIVERMLVDLLYAFRQGKREVCQSTQMFPLVFTLLEQIWEKDSFHETNISKLTARAFCPIHTRTSLLKENTHVCKPLQKQAIICQKHGGHRRFTYQGSLCVCGPFFHTYTSWNSCVHWCVCACMCVFTLLCLYVWLFQSRNHVCFLWNTNSICFRNISHRYLSSLGTSKGSAERASAPLWTSVSKSTKQGHAGPVHLSETEWDCYVRDLCANVEGRLGNSSSKSSESKYFRFCRSYRLYGVQTTQQTTWLFNTVILSWKEQKIKCKWKDMAVFQ